MELVKVQHMPPPPPPVGQVCGTQSSVQWRKSAMGQDCNTACNLAGGLACDANAMATHSRTLECLTALAANLGRTCTIRFQSLPLEVQAGQGGPATTPTATVITPQPQQLFPALPLTAGTPASARAPDRPRACRPHRLLRAHRRARRRRCQEALGKAPFKTQRQTDRLLDTTQAPRGSQGSCGVLSLTGDEVAAVVCCPLPGVAGVAGGLRAALC